MAFDIYQKVFDEDSGEYSEEEGFQYREQLLELFAASLEGQQLREEGHNPFWSSLILEYGMTYLGVAPPQITADGLREILFDLIPRKVSALAEAAPEVIHEAQLFWTFLEREFQLKNAKDCLKVLDDRAVRQLEREMSNPANFGMAKSIVMMGQERGFDMTSEEGMQEWIKTCNAERETNPGQPFSLPGLLDLPDLPTLPGSHSTRTRSRKTSADKTKRKMAKNSRKVNRGRK